jgi:hypothetical protein
MLGQWAFVIYGAYLWWKRLLEKMVLRWGWWMQMMGDLIVVAIVVGGWLVSYLVVQWSFASLLTENLQVVLHLCEPRLHSVDAFPMSFGALQRGLPSQNRLLFVPKPLDLLLDSG